MNEIHHPAHTDLNQLVVLDALLRLRSTTLVARRLGRTQSAISHTLSKLRETFGDPLFVRVGSGLRPTKLAESLEVPVRELMLRAESVLTRSEGAFDPRRIERTFVIAGTDFVEMFLLPRLLPWLRRKAPGVDLVTRFLGDDVERALQAREIDLAVAARLRPLSGIVIEPLRHESMVMLVRKGHPAARRRVTPKSYAALDHVLITPRGLPGSASDSALEQLGLTRRVVLRIPHFGAAAYVVSRTDLALTAPRGFATLITKSFDLAMLPLPFVLTPFTFSLGYNSAVVNDASHRWLRERIHEAGRAE